MKYERYENGILVEEIPYTQAELAEIATQKIKDKITALELEQTPRREREAILGVDNGWMANQEALIAIERAKL